MSTYHDDRRGGWHLVNVGHLVMGLAFLGLAAVWAAIQLDVVPDDDIRWLLPLPWVAAGAAGLIASAVASGLRWRRTPAEAPRAAVPDARGSLDDSHSVSTDQDDSADPR